jgi:4-hydroxybenzoyl-CoA thioesterase
MFVCTRTVRFGECDPAGVVYYPVFFDWFHQSMEEWFEKGLGHKYSDVITEYGFPAVHTEATYHKAIPMGMTLRIHLRVSTLGRSSMGLAFRIVDETEICLAEGKVRVVCISVRQGQFQFASTEIPLFLREKMQEYLKE